jgi:secreted Zn-dependent insulinase-like peptidase
LILSSLKGRRDLTFRSIATGFSIDVKLSEKGREEHGLVIAYIFHYIEGVKSSLKEVV